MGIKLIKIKFYLIYFIWLYYRRLNNHFLNTTSTGTAHHDKKLMNLKVKINT